jgi:hypothetical protein
MDLSVMNNPVEYLSSDSVPFFFGWLKTRLVEGKGGFFSAVVKKRTDGSLREFNAVVTSVDMDNHMATVWDAHAGDYRCVSFEGVKAVRTEKTDYFFS